MNKIRVCAGKINRILVYFFLVLLDAINFSPQSLIGLDNTISKILIYFSSPYPNTSLWLKSITKVLPISINADEKNMQMLTLLLGVLFDSILALSS